MAAATFETDLIEIITQAAEAAAMVAGLWANFKVVEQARDYYNLYNDQKQFYYSVFQEGAEAPLALDVYNTSRAVADYPKARAELYGGTGAFGGDMSNVLGWWLRHARMFGSAPAEAIMNEEYSQDLALFHAHWTIVMYRFQEANVDILNDVRWDHRMKLHNVALKQQSAVVSELASAEGQREDALTGTGRYLEHVSEDLGTIRGITDGHKAVEERYAALRADPTPIPLTPSRKYTAATTYGLGGTSSAETLPGHFETVQ